MTNQDHCDKVEKKPDHSVTTPTDTAITKSSDSDVVLKEQANVSKNRDKMPSGIQPAVHESFGIVDAVNSRSIDNLAALGTPESKQFAELRREIRRQMPEGEERDKIENETKKAIADVLKAGQQAHVPSENDGGIHQALGFTITRKGEAPPLPKQRITVQKDDSLSSIASFVLGKNAPPDEIKTFTEKIATLNQIKDPAAKLNSGDVLVLPPSTVLARRLHQ